MSGPVTVAHADREAYNCLMQDEGYDHEPSGAWHFARHRTATEAAWKARALGAMDEALLQGMNGASAPVSWLEGYCAAATIAKEALARTKATSEGGGHA